MQVQSWIALLEGDALKRCRRDRRSDRAFWAVPRMLIVVRAMLDLEGGKRPLAKRVRRGFADAITREREGDVNRIEILHCGKEKREGVENGNAVEGGRETGVSRSAVSAVSSVPFDVYESGSVSGSVSEFDFGFGDAGSGSESESNAKDGDFLGVDPEEDDVSEVEGPERRVEQVLPQLYLPELDMNITGIEGLSFNN